MFWHLNWKVFGSQQSAKYLYGFFDAVGDSVANRFLQDLTFFLDISLSDDCDTLQSKVAVLMVFIFSYSLQSSVPVRIGAYLKSRLQTMANPIHQSSHSPSLGNPLTLFFPNANGNPANPCLYPQTMSNTKRVLMYVVPVTLFSFALNAPKFMEVSGRAKFEVSQSKRRALLGLVGAFNQVTALIGAFSVIVKLQTSQRFVSSIK